MAIDSEEKRRSISALLNIHPGILPNSTNDAEQRQAAGYSYSGNAGNLNPPIVVADDKRSLLIPLMSMLPAV